MKRKMISMLAACLLSAAAIAPAFAEGGAAPSAKPAGVFFAHSLLSLLGKDPAHTSRSPEFLHALPCPSCSLRLFVS